MKEMSGEASVKPKTIPVSSSGKNPFGMVMISQPLSAISARLTSIVHSRKRSTSFKVRS